MDIRTTSRRFGAFSLVVGGLAVTAGTLFEPAGDDDTVAVALSKIAHHQSEQRLNATMNLLAVFILPAMLYLMRQARRGAPRLAVTGGTIAFAGWLAGLIGLGGMSLVEYHAAQLADRGQAVALLQAVTDDPTYGILVIVFVIGHLLGMLLLGIALWRAGAVPRWAAGLVALAPIGHLLVHDVSHGLDVAFYALTAVGLAGCAVALLRTDNGEWDLPALPAKSRGLADVPVVQPTPAGG